MLCPHQAECNAFSCPMQLRSLSLLITHTPPTNQQQLFIYFVPSPVHETPKQAPAIYLTRRHQPALLLAPQKSPTPRQIALAGEGAKCLVRIICTLCFANEKKPDMFS